MIQDRPHTRFAIESKLFRQHGIQPHQTTATLRLLEQFYVEDEPRRGPDEQPRRIYACGDAVRMLPSFREVLREKDVLFDRATLGHTGEVYVRALLKNREVQGYSAVTQKGRLGKANLGGTNIDLLATYKAPTGEVAQVLIEVKNRAETFYPSSKHIKKVRSEAQSLGRQPVFIAAYIHASAFERCRQDGVAVVELGSQIFPKSLERRVLALPDNVTGGVPFEFIDLARPFRNGLSPRAWEHARLISSRIVSAHEVWKRRSEAGWDLHAGAYKASA